MIDKNPPPMQLPTIDPAEYNRLIKQQKENWARLASNAAPALGDARTREALRVLHAAFSECIEHPNRLRALVAGMPEQYVQVVIECYLLGWQQLVLSYNAAAMVANATGRPIGGKGKDEDDRRG